ncbi:ABC-type zinc transport system, periplasmic binding protein [Desulfamplus magnetovallimortis]|uniref:ABC-type zinc transport system, periplasmic binding protein n=1 Tax=Desulfamplus magnetovallimortis TaxID=1246637 RepID=A0A1W1H9T5_9BACT|nr:zinc ABC transporter substrate-binding protein [Desulfamplus magnetovallimortis]SLM29196.1 ABC-type zinc transport system, periplasmic binding protein [Desulfamplus magnetovallimortis]
MLLTKQYILLIISIILLFFSVPSQASSENRDSTKLSEDEMLTLFVSIEPQAYFVERIGGKMVDVHVLVPPGKSPATYAPTPSQMLKLTEAKLFFTIGVPFEKALMPKIKKITGGLEIVDTTKGIELMPFHISESSHGHHEESDAKEKEQSSEHQNAEDEKSEDEHHHTDALDPHIWMNPLLVKIQAATILDALLKYAPEHKAQLSQNFNKFMDDLDKLHLKIKDALAPLEGETIFVYHPVFGYFAREYGLKQLAVERGGKSPRGKELLNFITEAKNNNVHVIFVQPQFDQNTANKIATAIKGVVVPLDPLARNYIENLENMASTIKNSLRN